MLHVMKTAGTSTRSALQRAAGAHDVFPNSQDLETLPGADYPRPGAFRDLLRTSHKDRATSRVIVGHLPYIFVDVFDVKPAVAVVLRDPIARTVSMMEHRRRHSPELAGQSYEQLLSNERFVERQVRDYQTKVFAFDQLSECESGVNTPLLIGEERFARALKRLESTEVVGVTDDLGAFALTLRRRTGLQLPSVPRRNIGQHDVELTPDVIQRIRALTAYDHVLVQRARERVAEDQRAQRWLYCLYRLESQVVRTSRNAKREGLRRLRTVARTKPIADR